MTHLAQLNIIASNLGIPYMEKLHQKILDQIQKDGSKNVVPSTSDINNLTELNYKEDLSNAYLDQIEKYLLDNELIYESFNPVSYVKNVRSKGKISLPEFNFRKNKNKNVRFEGEYPIDQKTGLYIIDI